MYEPRQTLGVFPRIAAASFTACTTFFFRAVLLSA